MTKPSLNITTIKCKRCKEPFKGYKRNGIFISKICPSCRNEKKLEKKEKHKQTKTYRESERKKLHKKAWKLMSLTVRSKYANWKDEVKCYTCEEIKPLKEMQCGHFHHNTLDFCFDNLRPQCPQCNTYKSGNLAVYATRLIQEIGTEKFVELGKTAKRHQGYSIEDLKKIIEDLTNGRYKN